MVLLLLPKWLGTYLLMFSYLLLVNLVKEGHGGEHQPKETCGNYCNLERSVFTGGRRFHPHNQPFHNSRKTQTWPGSDKLGMNKCCTLNELKDLAENCKGCLGKQWIPSRQKKAKKGGFAEPHVCIYRTWLSYPGWFWAHHGGWIKMITVLCSLGDIQEEIKKKITSSVLKSCCF